MTPIQTTKMSNFRWVICALLFLATTINYMDRQVLSLTRYDYWYVLAVLCHCKPFRW